MGTPAYMSPEQVMGEEVDGRSDLYSVGVLFYRLLTGALPFSADTALGMLQRQIRDNADAAPRASTELCRPGAIRSCSARSRRRPRIVSSRPKNSAMR